MDLNTAIAAHADWKIKLRAAAEKNETLDTATISADNCCPFGKWLHGEAKAKYGSMPQYLECVAEHANFHATAGKVAAIVNQGKFSDRLIGAGSPFAEASSRVSVAVLKLKKVAGL